MNMPSVCAVVDNAGHCVADVSIQGAENGWYDAIWVTRDMPVEIQRDLDWYDEVVTNQMLSFADAAAAAVDRHGLTVQMADGTRHPLYSLQVRRSGETMFRLSPVSAVSA